MRFFFFNDTATTEIYTLSLHDALPICAPEPVWRFSKRGTPAASSATTSPSRTASRSEEHTSELQSQSNLVCRLLLEKKKECDFTTPNHCCTAIRTAVPAFGYGPTSPCR